MKTTSVGIALLLAACTDDVVMMPGDDGPDPVCATGTLRSQTLAMGDGTEDRFYWLHVPATYDCETPAPLLVDFHGTAGGGAPEEAYQTDALVAFSETNGVIVVRPRSRFSTFQGAPIYRWDQNTGDLPRNVTFGKKLVTALEETYRIDSERVYASGFSSGSNMVAQFLTDASSPFKGIAPIAGGRWTANPLPSLANGPRIYDATGYRDYLWPYARSTIAELKNAGLPADRLFVRRTGGGHDLYAWHFDELWRFLDGGEPLGGGEIAAAWTATTLPSPADVNALTIHNGELVAAGAKGRVWRKTGGAWQLDLERGSADYTALCFSGSGGFVGGNYEGAMWSGTAWGTDITVPDYGQLGAGWINGAACRADGSIVVAGYWSAAHTTSAGVAWTQFGVPTGAGYENQVAGALEGPDGATVFVGYYDYVGVANAGTTSATKMPHMVSTEWWNAAAATTGGKFWVVGDNGLIAKSNNNGVSWIPQSSGTAENLYAVHFADGLHGAAVGRRGMVVVTSDGGATWTPRPLGKDAFLGAVYVDASTITIAGEDGLIATSAL